MICKWLCPPQGGGGAKLMTSFLRGGLLACFVRKCGFVSFFFFACQLKIIVPIGKQNHGSAPDSCGSFIIRAMALHASTQYPSRILIALPSQESPVREELLSLVVSGLQRLRGRHVGVVQSGSLDVTQGRQSGQQVGGHTAIAIDVLGREEGVSEGVANRGVKLQEQNVPSQAQEFCNLLKVYIFFFFFYTGNYLQFDSTHIIAFVHFISMNKREYLQ